MKQKKNIVITGASSGIGQAIANHLVSSGHQVIGTSRNPSKQPSEYALLPLDVTDDSSVRQFQSEILKRFGTVDVLINNAGFVISGPAENTTVEECKAQFETNYFGVVRVTNAFLPHFRKNRRGLIINTSSMAGLIGMPFQSQYSASKFALEGYMEALRMELLPFGVQVCNINPGDFKTSFTANRHVTKHIEQAYEQKFEQTLKIFEQEENNGADPAMIAKLVDSLIRKKHVRPRYVVGPLSQTMGVTMKRVFGATIFEKVMIAMWKMR